jgi:peptidyl-tRNA hydrolase
MCKLYIVVRSDLPPGLQAAQACHALSEFREAHPKVYAGWFATSKTLVLLGVPGMQDLESLAGRIKAAGVDLALNYEPDLAGELTAVALAPQARGLVRTLPLLLAAA